MDEETFEPELGQALMTEAQLHDHDSEDTDEHCFGCWVDDLVKENAALREALQKGYSWGQYIYKTERMDDESP